MQYRGTCQEYKSELDSLLTLKFQDLSGKHFNQTKRNEPKNNTGNAV